MAHKTLVNGTAYEVSGGRTFVNGTGYDIKSGRTLMNGTGYDISLFKPLSLNDTSWAQIREISDSGQAANYWSVGDRKAVTLNGTVGIQSLSGTYYCYIIGFDHNSDIEGTNRIHFQFGYSALNDGVSIAFIDSNYYKEIKGESFNINQTNSNTGGWKSSYMRNTLCPQFKNAMSSDLQAVLKTITKYTDNTGGKNTADSYVTATTDTVFLLAEYEVLGLINRANSAEGNYQAQYVWYSAGNSRVKYAHNDAATAVRWWTRSTKSSNRYSWTAIKDTGESTYFNSYASLGFAPAFCV